MILKIQRHGQCTYSPRHHLIKKCLRLISLKANNPGATEYPPFFSDTIHSLYFFYFLFFLKWNFNVAQQAGASLLNSIANENLSAHFLSDKVMLYSCVCLSFYSLWSHLLQVSPSLFLRLLKIWEISDQKNRRWRWLKERIFLTTVANINNINNTEPATKHKVFLEVSVQVCCKIFFYPLYWNHHVWLSGRGATARICSVPRWKAQKFSPCSKMLAHSLGGMKGFFLSASVSSEKKKVICQSQIHYSHFTLFFFLSENKNSDFL